MPAASWPAPAPQLADAPPLQCLLLLLLLLLLPPALLQVLNSTQEQIGALVDEVAALVPANASDAGG